MAPNIDPLVFLKEVKDTFQLGVESYDGFMNIMLDFQDQRVCIDDLLARIRELFKGHKNLISGFNNFLPESYQIITNEDEIAISFVNKVKTRFKDDHRGFESFIHLLDMYSRDKKSIVDVYEEVDFLFRSHHDLLLEFRNYLPDTSIGVTPSTPQPIHVRKKHKMEDNDVAQFRLLKDSSQSSWVEAGPSSSSDCDGLKSIHGQEFAFFEKVKAVNSDEHKVLLKYIELYNIGIISRSELQNMVDDLLENYPKLLKGFNEIFERSVKSGSEESSKNVASGGENTSSSKDTRKSIQELDLSKCEQITPSYRLLPEEFPVVIPKERTPTAKMVLNDHYICVAPGRDDYPFKQKPKNPYQDKLSQLEDARFEMDMFKECLNSTISSAQEWLKSVKENKIHGVLCLEKDFKDRNFRCIEKVFGDWGLEVLELLRNNPSRVLPIIIRRLLQKRAELVQYREYFNKCAYDRQNFTSCSAGSD